MQQLSKKYGLFTAICMVVGIVIGSGIFFKAQDVLNETNGDATEGVLAWIIGGLIMIVMSATFAVMATKYEKVNGVVDYAEAACGGKYAFFIAWFLSFVYYPAMTSVLAWVSARYTVVAIFGVKSIDPKALFGPECITIALFYLVVAYFINTVAPKLAGKVQISTTAIKLAVIFFIALVGTVIGLFSGTLGENFSAGAATAPALSGQGGGFVAALCCTAFAYEGWIIATSINSEIKNSKRNLPLALVIGAFIIMCTYVLYYIGVLGLKDNNTLMQNGTSEAFMYFGKVGATIINFLVIVSCLGTLNGLMLGCSRVFYSMAARGEGISPDTLGQVDKKTNMPNNSAALGLMLCGVWFVYFIGGQFFGWFGKYAFDSSEIPIVTVYPLYIPILVAFMIKEKEMHPVKRFVLPTLSIVGALVMTAASILRHGMANLYYLVVFAVIMGVGFFFMKPKKKETTEAAE
jgi:APA family basic amino acid/polyamine antiporter